MKFNVTHITDYFYGEPVPLCHNISHLKPRDTVRQTVLSYRLAVTPHPLVTSDRIDFFGNQATWFAVQEPHLHLRIVGRSTVDLKPFEAPTGFWWPAWDEVPRVLTTRRDKDFLEARQFTYGSPHVSVAEELAEYARPSFAAGRPLLECVTELTDRIYNEFTFDKAMTNIDTPVLEVLQHKHGVCQDFAHLQIGCLRSLGLAARYVSGYLFTQPPPGKARLVGADASHAWISVFFPDFGWIDFDPTNGVIPSSGHITLGWARDYSDISPVRGVVVGGRRHSLQVSVDVEPVGIRDNRQAKSVV
jgi:transglutaminase-like putative cysteine protease